MAVDLLKTGVDNNGKPTIRGSTAANILNFFGGTFSASSLNTGLADVKRFGRDLITEGLSSFDGMKDWKHAMQLVEQFASMHASVIRHMITTNTVT